MKHLVLAAAGIALAAPALAGGMDTPVIEPVVTANTTTIVPATDWTGPYVGIQFGYADMDAELFDAYGMIGGAHIGYRFEMGNFVGGAELDYNGSNVDDSTGTAELDSVTRLKLSAGTDWGSSLLYGLLGVASADATVAGADFSDTGWLAGVGMAQAINDRWVLGGEAIYHRFDDFDDQGIDVDVTTVELRASMKF